MKKNSVLDIAARIVDVLSVSKTPSVTPSTLLAWIEYDAKAAGIDGDRKVGRAINLTCDMAVSFDGEVRYSLKDEHR